MKKNEFPLEKILTISPKEWEEIEGTNLKDYSPVGVHCIGGTIGDFAFKVPVEAVVVVQYLPVIVAAYSGHSHLPMELQRDHHGVALIPKDKTEEAEVDEGKAGGG